MMRHGILLLAFWSGSAAAQQVVLLDFTAQPPPAVEVEQPDEDSVHDGAVGAAMQRFLSDRRATADAAAPEDACSAGQPPKRSGLSRVVLDRREKFWSIVAAAECRYGLPAGLLDALVIQESGYRHFVESPKGALGLTQLMPATARDLGVFDRHDPHMNVDGGARYLRDQLDRFGSVPLALAAYNAGPHRIKQYGGIPPFAETRGYVANVLRYWRGGNASVPDYIMRTAVRLGFTGIQ